MPYNKEVDYKSTAIILKTQRLGESDKILRLYSEEHGPIQVVAKGAYKVSSKFAAKAQVLNRCEFLLAKGKNLDIVKEMSLKQSFKHINQNYDALSLACFFVEIIDHIAINDDQYQELNDLLLENLVLLDNAVADDEDLLNLFAISTKFLWGLIALLGYKPELNFCAVSHKQRDVNQIPQYFDLENGGICSVNAYKNVLSADPYQDHIREMAPGVFQVFYDLDLEEFSASKYQLKQVFSSFNLLHKHIEHRLARELKSWSILEGLLQLA